MSESSIARRLAKIAPVRHVFGVEVYFTCLCVLLFSFTLQALQMRLCQNIHQCPRPSGEELVYVRAIPVVFKTIVYVLFLVGKRVFPREI